MSLKGDPNIVLPPGLIPIRKAALICWAVWKDNETFELEAREIMPEYISTWGDEAQDRIRLKGDFDNFERGDIVIESDGQTYLLDAWKRDLSGIPEHPSTHQIRTFILDFSIPTYLIGLDGSKVLIPFTYWRDIACMDALKRPPPTLVQVYGPELIGTVAVPFLHIKRHLTQPGWRAPLLRLGRCDDAALAGCSSARRQAASGEISRQRHTIRHAPQRSRAERALCEIYPTELPGRDVVSDAALCEQVNAWLKAQRTRAGTDLVNVGDAFLNSPVSLKTVLRAAGRRP